MNTGNYCRGADGIFIVYDVTNRDSFINIKQWLEYVDQRVSSSVKKLLVGNKCDMEFKRVVEYEEAKELADSLGEIKAVS